MSICDSAQKFHSSKLVNVAYHENNEKRFSTTLIETVAQQLNLDPTNDDLCLDHHIDAAWVDKLLDTPINPNHCTALGFDYQHLTIIICSCGQIRIYQPAD